MPLSGKLLAWIEARADNEFLAAFVDRVGCYEFEYSQLEEASVTFDNLAARP